MEAAGELNGGTPMNETRLYRLPESCILSPADPAPYEMWTKFPSWSLGRGEAQCKCQLQYAQRVISTRRRKALFEAQKIKPTTRGLSSLQDPSMGSESEAPEEGTGMAFCMQEVSVSIRSSPNGGQLHCKHMVRPVSNLRAAGEFSKLNQAKPGRVGCTVHRT